MTQVLTPESLLKPAREYVASLRDAKESLAIALTEITQAVLVAVHKGIRGLMERGVERRTLVLFLEEFADLLKSADDAVGDADQQLPSVSADVSRSYRRKVTLIRKDVAALLSWLNQPLPSIDPARLPAPSQEKDAPGFVGLDALYDEILAK